MSKLSILFYAILLLLLVNGCQKDEIINENISADLQFRDLSLADSLIINEVIDSFNQSNLIDFLEETGSPNWSKATITTSSINNVENLDISKVIVPFEQDNGDIEYLLYAFKFSDGSWRTGIVNKYHYLTMFLSTTYQTNKYAYASILKDFDFFTSPEISDDLVLETRDFPLEDVIIITEDGTRIYISGGGGMYIFEGPGTYCVDGTDWGSYVKIIWTNPMHTIIWQYNPDNITNGINWSKIEFPGFGPNWSFPGIQIAGSIFINISSCLNADFFMEFDPIMKRNWAQALKDIILEYDIPIQNYIPQNGEEDPCPECFSLNELSCLALALSCIEFNDKEVNTELLVSCMSDFFIGPIQDLDERELECYQSALNMLNDAMEKGQIEIGDRFIDICNSQKTMIQLLAERLISSCLDETLNEYDLQSSIDMIMHQMEEDQDLLSETTLLERYGLDIRDMKLLSAKVDLPCDDADYLCALSFEKFILQPFIKETIENNSITDPCNPNISAKEILSNSFIDKCINNKNLSTSINSIDELLEILGNDGNEYIYDFLTDEKLKCIYENYLVGSDNQVYCNTFSNFFGSTTFNLYLQNFNDLAALASTTFYEGDADHGSYVQIAFGTNQLEGYCEITVALVFLHEGIHAEMYRQLNDPSIDPNDKAAIWDAWKYNQNDHENMAEAYIGSLMSALKSIFGNRYTDLEYEAIAWRGLGNVDGENVNTNAWNELSEEKKIELQNTFSNINNNCDEDFCKE